jgi:hypothetical protein
MQLKRGVSEPALAACPAGFFMADRLMTVGHDQSGVAELMTTCRATQKYC